MTKKKQLSPLEEQIKEAERLYNSTHYPDHGFALLELLKKLEESNAKDRN